MASISHYPGYDVMREAEAWDDHTREIVRKRLAPFAPLRLLTAEETQVLRAAAATLVDDDRPDLLTFVVSHVDGRLHRGIGESQRKPGVPAEADLVRRGLAALQAVAHSSFGQEFWNMTIPQRQSLLGQVERAELPPSGPWRDLPPQEFFQKLIDLTIPAYYSHPTIWSEIGHGGPAYPRGYVRVELGLADPWEAKRETS